MIIDKTIFNNVNLYYNTDWKNIGYMVSGGLDSALGLFLLAKELKENNLKININPITYILDPEYKPSQENYLKNVIPEVRKLSGYDFILDPQLVFLSKDDSRPVKKDEKMRRTNEKFIATRHLSALYISDTLNPPEEVRSLWDNDDNRSSWRDAALPSVEIHGTIAFVKPIVKLTKHDVIKLYKELDLLDSLASLTISCDETINGIEFHNRSFPCGECWWCRERRWGFESNGLEYEKYSK